MDSPQQKKKTSWITIAFLSIAVAGLLLVTQEDTLRETYRELVPLKTSEKSLPDPVSYSDITNTSVEDGLQMNDTANPDQPQDPAPLPEEFLLDVPFTTQAPFANWELPYQEACEEASALTVHYYYQNASFSKEIADREILALVDFQTSEYGDYKDTTAEETAKIITEYWDYNRVDVVENPNIEDIKQLIAEGHPVIVPAAGRMLGNPHFTGEGPLYHMLVITGYNKSEFITNDVGTRFGEDYTYSYDTIMNAMHDWNSGDVANGAKRIVVVYPN